MKRTPFPASVRDNSSRGLIYSDEGRLTFHNDEGYSDPTAYTAMRRVDKAEHRKNATCSPRARQARPRTLVARYD